MSAFKAHTYLFLVFATLLFASCTSISTPPLVHPSRIGLEIDLATIMNSLDEYTTYFSARAFNPSALPFVPKDSPYTVVPEKKGMGQGWNLEPDATAIKKMLNIINDRDRMKHPVLKALIRPVLGNDQAASSDLLGFLFSISSTFARPVADTPMTFKIYQIPEIPRNGETNDDNGFLWGGGFRN
jgi:hypothetical protein